MKLASCKGSKRQVRLHDVHGDVVNSNALGSRVPQQRCLNCCTVIYAIVPHIALREADLCPTHFDIRLICVEERTECITLALRDATTLDCVNSGDAREQVGLQERADAVLAAATRRWRVLPRCASHLRSRCCLIVQQHSLTLTLLTVACRLVCALSGLQRVSVPRSRAQCPAVRSSIACTRSSSNTHSHSLSHSLRAQQSAGATESLHARLLL